MLYLVDEKDFKLSMVDDRTFHLHVGQISLTSAQVYIRHHQKKGLFNSLVGANKKEVILKTDVDLLLVRRTSTESKFWIVSPDKER